MKNHPRRLGIFVFLLFVVEYFDEWVFGIRETALPMIRDEFGLTYVQIGLLTTIPNLVSMVIEPIIGIWADLGKRRVLILAGGFVYALEMLVLAISSEYWMLMAAMMFTFPASGAFVSLSQATLMDSAPLRHQQNMARWTFAGSLGVVSGPITLALFLLLGASWREAFMLMALVGMTLTIYMIRFDKHIFDLHPVAEESDETEVKEQLSFWQGLKRALAALQQREVVRWLVLLEFCDLMLDVLFGYLALYFVDVVGVSQTQAGLAIAVWTVVGLAGDFLLIPLLERIESLTYLRWSVVSKLMLYPAFLLVDHWGLKLMLLGLLGFMNAGWYSVLQGQLYSSLHGQSSLVLTLDNISGVLTLLFPVILGAIADQWGFGTMMWALLAGPIVLLLGLPRPSQSKAIPLPDWEHSGF